MLPTAIEQNNHDHIFDKISQHDTMHASHHTIKSSYQTNDDTIKLRSIVFGYLQSSFKLRVPGLKAFSP